MSVHRVRVQLLGGVSLFAGECAPVNFAYDKLKALLAYLAMQPGAQHPRAALADMLWPQSRGATALGNLRRAVFDLRKILDSIGAPPIQADRRHLSWGPETAIDVDALNLLNDANGDAPWRQHALFLGGMRLHDAPDFDLWSQAQQHRLLQHALTRLDQHLQRQRQGGAPPDLVIELARHRVHLAPQQEPGHQQLIRLLIDANHLEQAQAAFEACQQVFRPPHGPGLSEATQALGQHMAQQRLRRVVTGSAPTRQPITVLLTRWPAPASQPDFAMARAQVQAQQAALTQQQGGQFLPLTRQLWVSCFGVPTPLEDSPGRAWDVAMSLAPNTATGADKPIMALAHGWTEHTPGLACLDATGEVLDKALHLALGGAAGWLHACDAAWPLLQRSPTVQASLAPGEALQRPWRLHRTPRPLASKTAMPGDEQLVGRQAELSRLLTLWARARVGHPVHVQVRAEAGMGKSHLARHVLGALRSRGHRTWMLTGDEFARHQPWAPIVQALQEGLRDVPERPIARRERQLHRVLRCLPEPWRDQAPTVRRLLGLPSTLDELAGEPGRLRLALAQGLTSLVQAMTDQNSLLLLVEDTQWLDDATAGALQRLSAQAAPGQHWMVLSTARPGAPDLAATHALELGSLSATEALALAQQRAPRELNAALDEQTLAALIDRADGVPLYLEQLLWARATEPEASLPTTLCELLVRRIAGLGPHQELAQLAALTGRRVDVSLLGLLLADQGPMLQHGLEALQQQGILKGEPDGQLVFRHALLQEAACASMTVAHRVEAHRTLSTLMRIHMPARVRAHPEQLAQHLDQGHSPDAPAAWLAAARRMNKASEPKAACHHLESGLAALAHMPDGAPRFDMAFRLWVELGNTRVALDGYGSQSSRDAYGQALDLCGRLSDDADLFQVMWGLWLGSRTVADDAPPLAFAERLAHAARGSDDAGVQLQVHYAFGNNHFWLGQYPQARTRLLQAVSLSQQVDTDHMIALYGEASHVCAMAFLSWLDWLEGAPTRARSQAQAAIDEARKTGHAHTLCFALTFSCTLHRYLRMPEETLKLARQVASLAEAHGLRLWQAAAAALAGWAQACLGQADALLPIRQGLAGAQQAMAAVETTFIAFLADALCHLGDDEEAMRVVQAGIDKSLAIPDVYLLPEFWRLQGELHMRSPNPAWPLAQHALDQGLALAERQGATSWVLRLLISQLKLAQHTGGQAQAQQRLRECLQRCDDGSDTPDLQEARRCLNDAKLKA